MIRVVTHAVFLVFTLAATTAPPDAAAQTRPMSATSAQNYATAEAAVTDLIDALRASKLALAYVDAQKVYFALTSQHGEPQFAQRIAASPARYDGLYWPAGEGVPDSPLEPLVAQAREEGYPIDNRAEGPRPYQGYYFRILTAQGMNSPEGRVDYISNG